MQAAQRRGCGAGSRAGFIVGDGDAIHEVAGVAEAIGGNARVLRVVQLDAVADGFAQFHGHRFVARR